MEALIAALRDPSVDVRWNAAEALGEIGDARAVHPFITALNDDSMKVRESATKGLGKIGSRAIPPLLSALQDPNRYVRESAAQALQRIALNETSGGGYLANHLNTLNELVNSGNLEARQVLATFKQCLES